MKSHIITFLLLSLFYLAAILFILGFLIYDLKVGGNSWKQGDWLINNEFDTIRRGWLGSFFLDLSYAINVNPVYIVGFLQGLITVCIFFVFLLSGYKLKGNDIAFFLLVSPAFIMFWFNDPGASMRKEILSYLAFVPLIFSALYNNRYLYISIIISVVFYSLAVFSHEANIFFVPFYVVSILIIKPKDRLLIIVSAFSYIAIAIAGLTYALFNSSVLDYMDVCKPVLDAGSSEEICKGAIQWLERDIYYAIEVSKGFMLSSNLYKFLIAYIFSLLIFVYLLKNYFSVRFCFIIAIFSSLCFLPLYVIAIDWGRWINYYTVSLTIVILIWMLSRGEEFKNIRFNDLNYYFLLLLFSSFGIANVGGYISIKHSYITRPIYAYLKIKGLV